MTKCISCDKDFEKPDAWVLMNICPQCLNKNRNKPDAYITKGSLFIPNPEYKDDNL